MALHRRFTRTQGRSLPRQAGPLIATILLMSCGGSVDLVPRGPRGRGGPPIAQVSTLPPPSKVEVIPLRRHPECFWQDGHWEPEDLRGHGGSAWAWKPGSWVRAEATCRYAPPQTTVENSGSGTRLLYIPGAYYAPESGHVCPPPPSCE